MIKAGRFVYALVLVLVMSADAWCASKSPDAKSRSIYQLFMKHNPKLEASTANKYIEHINAASSKYKQDSYVIAAIIVHESTVNNKAVSKGGDYGLMQVRWKVHEKAIKKEYPKVKTAKDMFDPKVNIFFGTRIFSECAAKSKNLEGALMRYSGNGTKLTAKVMNTVNELKAAEKKAPASKQKTAAKPKTQPKTQQQQPQTQPKTQTQTEPKTAEDVIKELIRMSK